MDDQSLSPGDAGAGQPPTHTEPASAVPPPFPPVGAPVYYPPPQRKGGFWAKVRSAMMTVMLIGSVLFNVLLVLIIASVLTGGIGGKDGVSISEQVYRPGDSEHCVALIDVAGLIEPDLRVTTTAMLRRAQRDQDVKGVLLRIDTAGGTITDSDMVPSPPSIQCSTR